MFLFHLKHNVVKLIKLKYILKRKIMDLILILRSWLLVVSIDITYKDCAYLHTLQEKFVPQ